MYSDASEYMLIEINTWQGEKTIDPVMALSLYFIALRKEAEAVANKTLHTVVVRKTKYRGDVDYIAYRDAARYASLDCIDVAGMPQIYIH